jgi:predicted CopG family antitoxin
MMRIESVELIYYELLQMKQCKSRSDFSRNWLGREESYFRNLQAKNLKSSIEVQVNLAARLRDLGMNFTRCEYPILHDVGQTYLRLYGELLDALLASAQSDTTNSDCADDRVQQ